LEAELRGVAPAGYGFVFGLPSLSQLIFCPIFGKYGPRIGIKFCTYFGVGLEALCGFLFGFLAYVKDATLFISLSALLRFFQGFGGAISRSSVVLVLSGMYPDKVMHVPIHRIN
jgi:MFS family permease